MRAFKLQTLKQKLWAIVAASLIARVILFFALPNTPSSLAPDEGVYASLAKWIANSELNAQHPYYTDLFEVSRSLIVPSSLFVEIGIDEISATRITSSIYGFLSLLVVNFLIQSQIVVKAPKVSVRSHNLVLILFGCFAFFPSHFLWSTLGLRESANEFWLILAYVSVFIFYKEEQSKKPLIAALIAISIVCTFNSRPPVGWVLTISILLFALFKLRNKVTYLLITSVLAGLIAGYLATTSFSNVTSALYVAKESTPTPTKESTPTPTKESTPTPTKESTPTPTKESTPTPTKESTPTPTSREELNASKLCDESKSRVDYAGKTYNCIKTGSETKRAGLSNLAEVAIDQVEALPGRQIINQSGAASMIQRLTCPLDESSKIGKYACLAFRAPYMTLTFLFRPLPFIDTTSASSVFAATENTLWILMFLLIIHRILKVRRVPFLGELAPSIIFFSLYVVGAGSYEGNMGTAFRHKSLILWVVLLLIFAVFWRDQGESGSSQGNNSQESAV